MYVKAMDRDEAVGIASLILAPYDMIVKDVIVPGEELYGTCEGGADTPNDVGDLFKKHWAEKYPNTKEF
jgi:hypothetical protein|tara:strand:- start:93 stop:299 length:207 start_codon:yes stop_codon:yes gene_type:complete